MNQLQKDLIKAGVVATLVCWGLAACLAFGETTYIPNKPTKARITTPASVTTTDSLTKFQTAGSGTIRPSKTGLIITTGDTTCIILFGVGQTQPPIIVDPPGGTHDPVDEITPDENMQATVQVFRNIVRGYGHNESLGDMFAGMIVAVDSLSFNDTAELAKWQGTFTKNWVKRNKLPEIKLWTETLQDVTKEVLGDAVIPVDTNTKDKALELYEALEWACRKEVVKK